jgi:hypothetical protein
MGADGRSLAPLDRELRELAELFVSRAAETESSLVSRLDFRVESLGVLEGFLDALDHQALDDEAYGKLVLRCGAYVGEVIREATNGKRFHWIDNDEAVRLDPRIAGFGESLATAAILWDGARGFHFPVAKVMKFLENGREDSVKFFAQVVIGEASRN